MTQPPDSGDPGNLHHGLGIDGTKPELLTEATWNHLHALYQLRGDLGKGSQAVVLLVKERAAPQRRLAIKVYHENTDAARKLFDHECRVLASEHLPQDLVVGYVQCVSEPGLQPYIVLEHIDGKPIVEYVQAARSMSVADKITFWEKFVRSLHRLHQCHLVFGDLSPKNVLVEKDDVIRFIDLAGSKPLKRAFSGSQSSQNIATPNVMPAAWLSGEARTALWTDIYAASAIGFQILTGHDKGDLPAAQWEAELMSHGVPGGVRRVVLKGLREKDTHKTDDLNLYPSAEHLANDLSNWRTRQRNRRAFLQQAAITLVLLVIVGGFGVYWWTMYEAERQAHDVRTFKDLQRQVERLPNVTHPGVTKFVEQADETQRTELSTGGRAGVPNLQPAIKALRQALSVSRDIEWAESLRESLGEVLNESPWLMSAKAIAERQSGLAKRFLALKDELAAGRTDELQPSMATLHRDLAKLAQDNTLALPADQQRLKYERLAKSVAEEVRGKDAFVQIAKSAQDSHRLLDEGKWRDAELHFGSCTQRLTDWLKDNETAEQRALRTKADQEMVAVLEQEKQQLKADVARVNETLKEKESVIATLNGNLAKLGTDAANARIAEQKATDTLKSEQAKLASLQKAHKEASEKLAQANLDLAAAKPKLDTFEVTAKRLAELTKERDRLKADKNAAEELIANLKPSDGTQPGVPQVVFDANKIAATIKTRLDKLDLKNREAAQQELNTAVADWQKNETAIQTARDQRAVLLKTNAEDGSDVQRKDREITALVTASGVKAATIRQAFAKRDEGDRFQFDEREAAIAQYEKIKQTLLGPPLKRLPNSPDVLEQAKNIAVQKRQQEPFVVGAQRAAGTGQKLSVAEIVALAGVLPAMPGGEFTSKSTGMVLMSIPAGEFLMGSPSSEENHESDEGPQHKVRVSAFRMGKYEVTQGEFQKVLNRNPSHFSYTGSRKNSVAGKDTTGFPVEAVTWYDAIEFCIKLSEADGLTPYYKLTGISRSDDQSVMSGTVTVAGGNGYRLPTEAEWEYACRAGTTTPFHFGSVLNGDQANVNGNNPYGTTTKGADLQRTTTVGPYSENDFGLFDMHGNVLEWSDDVYDASLYGKRSGTTTDPKVTSGSEYRVLRGGLWCNFPWVARSAVRYGNSPGDRSIDSGFRVVCSVFGVRTP